MGTFRQNLSASGKGVLDARAANLAELTQIEAERRVNDYRTRVLRIKNQIAAHEDLAVTSRDSLVVGGKDFDPSSWTAQGVELEKQLRLARIEYKLVQAWYDRLFPREEEVKAEEDNIPLDE